LIRNGEMSFGSEAADEIQSNPTARGSVKSFTDILIGMANTELKPFITIPTNNARCRLNQKTSALEGTVEEKWAEMPRDRRHSNFVEE
jgi:hypothetical protein